LTNAVDLTPAIDHLRGSDPVMRELVDQIGLDAVRERGAGRPSDHYGTLVRSIVGQQLSTKAAGSIYARLIDRFGGRPPTPEEVLANDPEDSAPRPDFRAVRSRISDRLQSTSSAAACSWIVSPTLRTMR
jgi:3-methyladenine DNA glycosylase/8-oxoguanine DNA glycosylase